MAWKESDLMSLRQEFVVMARRPGVTFAEVCRRYSISRKTGYKWLKRSSAGEHLADRSRRPRTSPTRTDAHLEQAVLQVRRQHPAWGGRKINAVLARRGLVEVPAPSTITQILRRHGLLDERTIGATHRPMKRFEHERPNDLWQMDFKGHFALNAGGRCHPLTVLDDHSRFSLCLSACTNERGSTVRSELTLVFKTYGLPLRILCDNGSPWSGGACEHHTPLTVWLMQLGVGIAHGRPYHPQTQGKDERFHGTLKRELLAEHSMRDTNDAQRRFDAWRRVYNHERPHEALGLGVPADRYRLSPRAMPDRIEAFEYGPDDRVRVVDVNGRVSFMGQRVRVPKALRSHRVALRPTARDGVFELRFREQPLGELDMRTAHPSVRVSGRSAPSDADRWV
jgi:transposase InsO family protein